MTDENHETRAAGDDAFGGGVGDDLPGGDVYRGRHARPGEGDGVPDGGDGATDAAGVPSGWPAAEGDLPPTGRPTSPTSGAGRGHSITVLRHIAVAR